MTNLESTNNDKFFFFQRIVLELLRVAMVGIPNTKGFIVDGFPRELEQGKEFENEVFVLLMTKVECIFVNWYGQVPRH